jgi:deoxyribose-phosphate aldolase
MTKLYEKLIRICPSDADIKKGMQLAAEEEFADLEISKKLFSLIDLTSLNTTDYKTGIESLCKKINGFSSEFKNIPDVAAICVFPNFVPVIKKTLTVSNIKIASVAGSFPTSQTFKEIKIAESMMAVREGADEIDIVISVGAFKNKDYLFVIDEIKSVKEAIGQATLKVIIESGLLESPELIFKASIIAMDAGADFIKTSTGKTSVSATLSTAYIMCRAIYVFYSETGIKVGFKAAGGIVTPKEALSYYRIVKHCLGQEWTSPDLFRIGASRLANNLLSDIRNSKISYF